MAKKKIHIDELFRRELGDMKMPVDTNDWAAMQTQIAAEQDKRKRRVFWWWFAGIALLLLMGASTTYYFLEANSQSDTIVTENTTPTPPIETPSETETSSENENENEIENSTSNQQTEEKEISSKNSENAASDRQVNSSTPSNKRETNGTKDNSVKEIKKKLDENKNNRNRKPKDDIKTDKNEGGNGKKTPTPTLNDKQQVSPKVTPKPDTTESNNNDTKDKTVTKIVSSDSTQTSGDSTKQAKKENPTKKGKDGSITAPKLSPFSLGFSIGGTSNSFTADENSNFGRILNNGNQPALGFNVLIPANYAFNNFEINSGLGINSITNNGSYNYTHQTFDSIPVLGPLGEIRGYFYVNFRDTSHSFNLTSSFTSITLPIGVSYNIKLNNNSGLRLGANTSINYLVGARGEYINPFNLFKLDVSNNKDLFRKWNLGLGASVGYYYSFKPQWTLETSINYNTLTNGIFDDRIGTAIRPSSIGINIGVRYNFKLRK